MKILLVTHFFPTHQGGIETVAARLAEATLAKRSDFRIDWFASAPAGPPSSSPNLHYWPQKAWNGIEALSGLPAPLWGPRALLALRKAVVAADVVHLHDVLYCANWLAAYWARRYGKPLVVTQHVGPIPYRNSLLRRLLEVLYQGPVRRVLNRADWVVFISPAVAAYFAGFCAFSNPPVYIANGVDTECFCPQGEVLVLPEIATVRANGGRVFLFVGRFVEKKGLTMLRELCGAMPADLWLFAGHGADNPERWQLGNVKLLRNVSGPSLAACYRAADLLVLPSYGEGFPLVVQEAMACGTPALISEATAAGAPDMHMHLHAESLAAPEAFTRWQQRLRDFQPLDIQQRQTLADAAATRWSWPRAAREYAEVFERSLEDRA